MRKGGCMHNKSENFSALKSELKEYELKGLVLFSIKGINKKISDLKEEIARNEFVDISCIPHNERHEILGDINAAKLEIAILEKAKSNFEVYARKNYHYLLRQKNLLEYEISSLENRIENYEINCRTVEFGEDVNTVYSEELKQANKELYLKEQSLKLILNNLKQLSY